MALTAKMTVSKTRAKEMMGRMYPRFVETDDGSSILFHKNGDLVGQWDKGTNVLYYQFKMSSENSSQAFQNGRERAMRALNAIRIENDFDVREKIDSAQQADQRVKDVIGKTMRVPGGGGKVSYIIGTDIVAEYRPLVGTLLYKKISK